VNHPDPLIDWSAAKRFAYENTDDRRKKKSLECVVMIVEQKFNNADHEKVLCFITTA